MTGDVVPGATFWAADDPAAGCLDRLQVTGLEHLGGLVAAEPEVHFEQRCHGS